MIIATNTATTTTTTAAAAAANPQKSHQYHKQLLFQGHCTNKKKAVAFILSPSALLGAQCCNKPKSGSKITLHSVDKRKRLIDQATFVKAKPAAPFSTLIAPISSTAPITSFYAATMSKDISERGESMETSENVAQVEKLAHYDQVLQSMQDLANRLRNLLTFSSVKNKETLLFDALLEDIHTQEQQQQEGQQTTTTSDKESGFLFPPLTDKELDKIEWAFNHPDTAVAPLIEKFNISITRHDINTLRRGEWLNDEVINFYFNLIQQSSPHIYCFNSFFYEKLNKQGYQGVKRWTKKVDLFSFKKVLLPVHLGVHWACVCIDMSKKRVEYYDSLLGSSSKQVLKYLMDYVGEEWSSRRKGVDTSVGGGGGGGGEGWTSCNIKNIPQQENSYDCGVFTCMYAEYLARNAQFDFTQGHMNYLRGRMVYEIVTGELSSLNK